MCAARTPARTARVSRHRRQAAQPIPKGLPGPGLLAHVITDKDVDHIPLHRQEGRLARQGVEISRSTLCDWMGSAAKLLEPLYNLMKTLILLSGTIHTDDTTVKVRDSKRKIKRTGRLWFYGDCPSIHPCSRFAPWISLGFGLVGLSPTLCAHCPPQHTPALQERRQIFRRLCVKHISCHSADTFSSPRNRNLRIPRADLI